MVSTTSSKEHSVEKSTSKLPEQEQLMRDMIAQYQTRLGAGEPIYEGETVAPLSEIQSGVLSNMPDFLKTFSATNNTPLYNQSIDTLSKILSGESGAKPISEQDAEDYYSKVIAAPAMKQFKETTMPTVQEQYAGPGYWSSARAKAGTQAAEDLSGSLDTQRSELGWNVLQQNQALEEAKAGRALSAVEPAANLETNVATNKLAGLTTAYGLGEKEQAQKQAYINAEIDKFMKEQHITSDEDLQTLMSLLEINFTTSGGHSQGSTYSYTF